MQWLMLALRIDSANFFYRQFIAIVRTTSISESFVFGRVNIM